MNTIRRLAARAVHDCTQVEFLVDIGSRLNQDLADRLAIGIGLVGHQPLVQPLLGERTRLVFAAYQLDTTGLAATTGMDLSLDHPLGAPDLVTGFGGLLRAVYRVAFRHRQSIFCKQLLTLVLVKIHASYRYQVPHLSKALPCPLQVPENYRRYLSRT